MARTTGNSWLLPAVLIFLLLVLTVAAFMIKSMFSPHVDNNRDGIELSYGLDSAQTSVSEKILNPQVILALDVSESMPGTNYKPGNDPQNLQAQAVMQFYQVFQTLANEIVDGGKGENAYIGVILFATIAQVIQWDKNGSEWLPVLSEAGNFQRFKKVVTHFLGDKTKDLRRGKSTNHAAALAEIERLLPGNQETSPPLVILMTDGAPEPNFCYTAPPNPGDDLCLAGNLSEAAKQEKLDALAGRFRMLDGYSDYENSGANPGPHIFIPMINMRTAVSEETIDRQIYTNVRQILARSFVVQGADQAVPLLWAPVLLDPYNKFGDRAKKIFIPDGIRNCDTFYATGKPELLPCKKAEELQGRLIAMLARWFRLKEFDMAGGGFIIPSQTAAFAVSVNLDRPPTGAVVLVQKNGLSVPMSGDGTSWAAVSTTPGEWTVRAPGAGILQGKYYLQPRYGWVLQASPTDGGGNTQMLRVDILPNELKSNKPIAINKVLPNHIPLRLAAKFYSDKKCFQESAYKLTLTESSYSVNIPIGTKANIIELSADLAPFKAAGLPVNQDTIRKTVEIRPSSPLILTDENGKRAKGVYAVDLPVSREFWKNIMEKGFGLLR